jgi:hypothetical protein
VPQVKAITLTPAATDADGICQSQTPGGAGALTINGALASGGSVTFTQPQHITITAAANDSARTFTVIGTDRQGVAITKTITGPNATTVADTTNFKTISSVSVDAATAGAITVGVNGLCESQWYPTDYRALDSKISFGVTLSTGASLTYTVEHTFDDVQALDFVEADAITFDNDTVASETTNQNGNYTNLPTAIRLAVTAYTSGSATINIVPSGGA